jgi:hypothetical protein
MVSSFYTLGPHTIQVISPDCPQRAALERCWRLLFQIQPVSCDDPSPSFLLDLTQTVEIASTWSDQVGHGSVWQEEGRFWLREGESLLRIDVARFQAVGHIATEFWTLPIVAQRDFFQRLFFLLARSLGGDILHANALYPSTGGREAGYLLIGESGVGKTTLSLSLIRAGWGYVGDDILLLNLSSTGNVSAFGIRRGFACTQESAAEWSDWADLMASGISLNRQKTLLDLEQILPCRASARCSPHVLLFLTQTGDAHTQLRPLDSTQAFLRLLARPGAGILLDPKVTTDLLMLLKLLVEQTHAYQLLLGRDVYTHPLRVAALLESLPIQAERSNDAFGSHPHHRPSTGIDHSHTP